jgi:hypothetical protein
MVSSGLVKTFAHSVVKPKLLLLLVANPKATLSADFGKQRRPLIGVITKSIASNKFGLLNLLKDIGRAAGGKGGLIKVPQFILNKIQEEFKSKPEWDTRLATILRNALTGEKKKEEKKKEEKKGPTLAPTGTILKSGAAGGARGAKEQPPPPRPAPPARGPALSTVLTGVATLARGVQAFGSTALKHPKTALGLTGAAFVAADQAGLIPPIEDIAAGVQTAGEAVVRGALASGQAAVDIGQTVAGAALESGTKAVRITKDFAETYLKGVHAATAKWLREQFFFLGEGVPEAVIDRVTKAVMGPHGRDPRLLKFYDGLNSDKIHETTEFIRKGLVSGGALALLLAAVPGMTVMTAAGLGVSAISSAALAQIGRSDEFISNVAKGEAKEPAPAAPRVGEVQVPKQDVSFQGAMASQAAAVAGVQESGIFSGMFGDQGSFFNPKWFHAKKSTPEEDVRVPPATAPPVERSTPSDRTEKRKREQAAAEAVRQEQQEGRRRLTKRQKIEPPPPRAPSTLPPPGVTPADTLPFTPVPDFVITQQLKEAVKKATPPKTGPIAPTAQRAAQAILAGPRETTALQDRIVPSTDILMPTISGDEQFDIDVGFNFKLPPLVRAEVEENPLLMNQLMNQSLRFTGAGIEEFIGQNNSIFQGAASMPPPPVPPSKIPDLMWDSDRNAIIPFHPNITFETNIAYADMTDIMAKVPQDQDIIRSVLYGMVP